MNIRDVWSFITNPRMLVRKIQGHPFWYLSEVEIGQLRENGFTHSGSCVYIHAHGGYLTILALGGWRSRVAKYLRTGNSAELAQS